MNDHRASQRIEPNEAVVRRFYDEMWNEGKVELADELLVDNLRFRASLGATIEGREAFKEYVGRIRTIFPDFHHTIDEILSMGDRVVVRLTYVGTHQGKLADVEPTGARVEYVGAGFFTVSDGRISEGWVVGDTQQVWRALGKL